MAELVACKHEWTWWPWSNHLLRKPFQPLERLCHQPTCPLPAWSPYWSNGGWWDSKNVFLLKLDSSDLNATWIYTALQFRKTIKSFNFTMRCMAFLLERFLTGNGSEGVDWGASSLRWCANMALKKSRNGTTSIRSVNSKNPATMRPKKS